MPLPVLLTSVLAAAFFCAAAALLSAGALFTSGGLAGAIGFGGSLGGFLPPMHMVSPLYGAVVGTAAVPPSVSPLVVELI